ncbi:protein FANTASTIC FOUR 2 [Sesamum alatum]|uniref:Protein FANTASTIC FOUR 2 n=1 Tax=Sesamum alatum TaxID=300844 RepID=A0AAE1XUN2_9LAMI|nr:protein FANTASTIC FOUR 2 [Sesamum alatum]
MSSSTHPTLCQDLLLLEPRVLLHQLAQSKPPLSFPWPQKQPDIPRPESSNTLMSEKTNRKNDQESTTSWNFTHNSCRQSSDETEQVYVHPLVKRAASCLSTRSLEMCTESLGSETGNCIDSMVDEFSHHGFDNQISKQTKTRELAKKVKHSTSFPPPLTSISGSDGVQVQTHREGGRLVIKAFSFSSCTTYFQTERHNGRLRLSLPRNEHELGENEDEEEVNDDDEEDKEEEENMDDESDEEADLNGRLWGENLKEWSSSRCNGDRISSRKRLPSLPYCVAIS